MRETDFEVIYRRYYKVLYLYSARIVLSSEIAKDIVQDVFTEFWFHRDRIDKDKSVKYYLYTMVRNKSLDYIKSSYYKLSTAEYLLEEHLFPIFFTENDLHLEELTKEINLSVSRLSEKCRLVFLMSREKNMTNKEIAEELKVSIKAVEKHITKAISEIKTHLHDAGYLSVILFLFFINRLMKGSFVVFSCELAQIIF